MEYAADSRQPEIAEELLAFFLENKLHDCFAASLYQMYDLLHPDVIMELAWKHKIMDFAMPYLIQVMRDFHCRVCKEFFLQFQLPASPVITLRYWRANTSYLYRIVLQHIIIFRSLNWSAQRLKGKKKHRRNSSRMVEWVRFSWSWSCFEIILKTIKRCKFITWSEWVS